MTKLVKILASALFLILEYTFIIIIFFSFLIRESSFQTFLGKKASSYLSEYLDADISIGKVDIAFYDRIYFDDVFLSDAHRDTLFYLHEFRVDLDMRKLGLTDFPVQSVHINNADFFLKKYQGEEFSNLQFLLDAFSSDKDTDPSDFYILLEDLTIKNSRFVFHDYNAEKIDFGINFKQLDISNIDLRANDIKITPEQYTADIHHFSFQEKSGFNLTLFAAKTTFDAQGLLLNQAILKTGNTKLDFASFHMKTKNYASYSAFLDEVEFISDINKSRLSMPDISYFAPTLRGMNQEIEIKGKSQNAIAKLELSDFNIKTGENTYLNGDFQLPDFRKLENESIRQSISSYYIDFNDLSKWKFPGENEPVALSLPDEVMRLGYVTGSPIQAFGTYNAMKLQLGNWRTNLGNISFLRTIAVNELVNPSKPIQLFCAEGTKKYLRFESFNLGRMLAINDLGRINGTIGLEASLLADEFVTIDNVSGVFDRFYAGGYNYSNVFLSDLDFLLDFKTKQPTANIDGLIYIRDENLDLVYSGSSSFGEEIELNIDLSIECASLNLLHPSLENRGELNTQLSIHGKGKGINTFSGKVEIDSLYYEENEENFSISHFESIVQRENGSDELMVRSDFVNIDLKGYVDIDLIVDNIIYQSSQVFPVFFADLEPSFDLNSKFNYSFEFFDINPILDVFAPQFQIAENTKLSGSFDGESQFFDLDINAKYFQVNSMTFTNINLFQQLSRGELLALYRLDNVMLGDSLLAQELNFTNIAFNNFMDSQLIFHDKWRSRSNLEWYTNIFETDGFDIDVLPSYFNINNHLWNLDERAHVNFSYDCFFIEDFILKRDNQSIAVNGMISKVPQDNLYIDIKNVELTDFGTILLPENQISGVTNVKGIISEPFTELKFSGDAAIQDLVIDERDIGDLNLTAKYDVRLNAISMDGSLYYKQLDQNTFEFKGDYLIGEEESLDFQMVFDGTDISLVNSFLDPQVVSGIRGKLNGAFDLKGSVSEPRIEGAIDLEDGRVNLAMLGANFFYSGQVKADRHGIYIDAMPIKDEEGNTGFLVGHMLHDNFSNFLYEMNFDFENHYRKRNPLNPSEPMKIERFLVMKTQYSEGTMYYGTAYATGSASISGSVDDMNIRVNAKTRRGTWINFPMYGPTTIEEDGFIRFKLADSDEEEEEEKGINFSGVQLALNFEITPEARVKLIFDENIGDEITAFGEGNLAISLDNYGEVALNGTFRVTDGVYNFAMGPYKQNFFIVPGGTVQWTGDPTAANLNIETFYRTNANLSVVMMDVIDGKTSDNEEILSYLKLRGNMMQPEISFDLDAPKANEAGKAVINRIRSDKDELNRQFFSILIWKRFQPLAGQEGRDQAGRGNAALDLVSTQLNSLLAKVSDDYKMNVNLESDELTGESSVEFGVTKGFMDDRLIVSGSFGVGSQHQENVNQNNLIYDLNIEYLINEKGTFRINVFNESNTNSVIQNTNRGQYTQGFGVNYREEFHNLRDFKMIQFVADIFRKKENRKTNFRDGSRFRPIPLDYKEGRKEEEQD